MKRYYENEEKLSNQRKLCYEKNRGVLLAKSKLNQQNRKSHTQQIRDLNGKVEELTQIMEIFFQNLNRFISISKWHSLTIHVVKFVINS